MSQTYEDLAKPTGWWSKHHGRELDAIAKRQGAYEAQRWAQGIAAEQLVTVQWMDFWKGLSK